MRSAVVWVVLFSERVLSFVLRSPAREPLLLRKGRQEGARVVLHAQERRESYEEEEPVLEDWRAFRARMIRDGLPTIESVGERERETDEASSEPPPKRELQVLDPENLALATSQTPALAEELKECWAHELAFPEVGSLLVRNPLEVQLAKAPKESYWGRRVREFGKSREEDWFAADPVGAYEAAAALLKAELERIATKGTVDSSGRLVVDASSLTSAERALLDTRQKYLDTWQEVLLVVDRNAETGAFSGVVLNRPAAQRSNGRLSAAICSALAKDQPGLPPPDAAAFQNAFGARMGSYVGCSVATEERAIFLSPVPLDGAREISPGLGIYRGGAAAAIEQVANAERDPFDFKLFLGSYDWKPGELEARVRDNVYQPLAVSRAIVLKQCINLPRPFWHELCEILGGGTADISRLEYAKRVDSSSSSGSSSSSSGGDANSSSS